MPDNIIYTAPKLDQLGGGKIHSLGMVYDHLPNHADAKARAELDGLCEIPVPSVGYVPPYGQIKGASDQSGNSFVACGRVILWPQITHNGSSYDSILTGYKVLKTLCDLEDIFDNSVNGYLVPSLRPLVRLPGTYELTFSGGTITQAEREEPMNGELPINLTLGQNSEGIALNAFEEGEESEADHWFLATDEFNDVVLPAMLELDHARPGVPHAVGLFLSSRRAQISCFQRIAGRRIYALVGANEDSRVYAHCFFLESLKPLFTEL